MNASFDGDVQTFSLSPVNKQLLKIQSFQKDKSFIQGIKSFPINTEIRSVKTFSTEPQKISRTPIPQVGVDFPAGLDAGVVTVELNTSILLLPEIPMRKRTYDARVGYFANGYDVFENESLKADKSVFAVRWRLEPKNAEDAEKQKKGELIERYLGNAKSVDTDTWVYFVDTKNIPNGEYAFVAKVQNTFGEYGEKTQVVKVSILVEIRLAVTTS
jgi:hypothetical protein